MFSSDCILDINGEYGQTQHAIGIQIDNEEEGINIKKALLKTTKTLSEIAKEFNFPNSTHLIRFFKKQENITPLAFRKQHKVILS